ncbi:MAG: electron transport complex subunit RsxC [Gammaproteobacteria bacterium]|nr:electron transport complex subunit RsxC [Gammaproteobacteria bacterium]
MYYPSPKKAARPLYKFPGGLHLPDNKRQSTGQPTVKAELPKKLVVPLRQHIGAPAQPLVKVGDRVLKGQLIANPQGKISAAVHAPSSGIVSEIAEHPVAHPSGLSAFCIVIETDGKDEWCELPPAIENFAACDPALLLERIRNSGIVGLGGASFPSDVKLEPGNNRRIDTLVINAAECEPFITCDDMLMRERPREILAGAAIMQHLVGAALCLIGIEDNKPEAIAALNAAIAAQAIENVEVVTIPTRYPSGGERQLIRVLTGKEVPSGEIPARIGIVCHNVGTALAVADAVLRGRPLISRYVTLTGEGVVNPRNLETLIGTSCSELIEQAGGYTGKAQRLIMGGPMMGFTLHSDNVPVVKASNCLLAASAREAPDPGAASACIRCGKCAEVCPVSLLPQQMYWYARAKDLEKTQEYNLFDCIECGCCSHVCPSHIPLVQYYRFAKNESWDLEREKKSAELARQRHEAKLARIARLEAEKKERAQKKRAALARSSAAKRGVGTEADPKKAAIEAALKRAAEKKAQLASAGIKPQNTEHLSDAQQRQIRAADARRVSSAETPTGEAPEQER